MPPKKSTRKRSTRKKSTRKRSQTGKGLVKDALKFAKNKKLLSKGLLLIPHPAAQAAGTVASMVGLGKKKRSTTRRRSTTRKRSTVSKKINKALAGTKTGRIRLRTGAVPPGSVPMSSAALAQLRGVRGGQYGAGFFSDLGGGIGSVFGGLGGGIGSVARGLFGGGTSARRARRSGTAFRI